MKELMNNSRHVMLEDEEGKILHWEWVEGRDGYSAQLFKVVENTHPMLRGYFKEESVKLIFLCKERAKAKRLWDSLIRHKKKKENE